jgi:hypothetical protein
LLKKLILCVAILTSVASIGAITKTYAATILDKSVINMTSGYNRMTTRPITVPSGGKLGVYVKPNDDYSYDNMIWKVYDKNTLKTVTIDNNSGWSLGYVNQIISVSPGDYILEFQCYDADCSGQGILSSQY